MKTENLLETWLDAQNEALNNCLETSRKFQEAAVGGTSLDKGTDIYKEFINGQMKVFKDLEEKASQETTGNGEQKGSTTFTPLLEKTWELQRKNLETLKKEQEKFLENLQNSGKDLFNNEGLTEQFRKTQEDVYNIFKDLLERSTEMANTAFQQTGNPVADNELNELKSELKELNQRLTNLEEKVTTTNSNK